MKFVSNRVALFEALMTLSGVITSRTPKAILQCVKLEALDGKLLLSATDMEVFATWQMPEVQVESAGVAVVPVEKLRDIVRESQDETLEVAVSDSMLTIRGKSSLFKIYTQPSEQFPVFAAPNTSSSFETRAGDVLQLVRQTSFAAAREISRYAFNGLLVSVSGDKLVMVATDGRRLAVASRGLTRPMPAALKSFQAIVPIKAMSLLSRIPMDLEDNLVFHPGTNQLSISGSRLQLTTTLVEGQFPPYNDVIPTDCNRKMTCSATTFLTALRQASILTTQDSGGVRFSFSEDALELTGRSAEAGEATINCPCKYAGEPLVISFNPSFLMEALKVLSVEEIVFEMGNVTRPGVLRAGPEFTYVVMPVAL